MIKLERHTSIREAGDATMANHDLVAAIYEGIGPITYPREAHGAMCADPRFLATISASWARDGERVWVTIPQ